MEKKGGVLGFQVWVFFYNKIKKLLFLPRGTQVATTWHKCGSHVSA